MTPLSTWDISTRRMAISVGSAYDLDHKLRLPYIYEGNFVCDSHIFLNPRLDYAYSTKEFLGMNAIAFTISRIFEDYPRNKEVTKICEVNIGAYGLVRGM